MTDEISIPADSFEFNNFIGGKACPSEGQERIDVISPYTGAPIGSVPSSTPGDVNTAVEMAKAGFHEWSSLPVKERSQVLFRFRDLLLERLDEISQLAALECGKTLSESRAGVLKGVEVVEFATSLQNSDAGGAIEVSRGVQCEYRREPLGVVCGIAPFNFPAMVPLWMYPIALALGNAFILKPSEKVPLTSQLVAECLTDAKLPAGAFTTINGGKAVVDALIEHPDVSAYGFVGSTPVAKDVYVKASTLGKRALCLGGAKNNLIVVPDADYDLTVDGVVSSFTGCAGQRCMAASLMLAVGDVDRIIAGVKEQAASLTLGTSMGAIITRESLERISAIIDRAEADGAKVILDGRGVPVPSGFENGYWMGPTIIDNASIDMECATTEIFGPVITIIRTKDLSEALELERGNAFGNATSVFTTSGKIAQRVAHASTAGMIGVNIGVPVPREPFSFGGTKDSKFGVTDITGEGVLDFWSYRKKITTKWAQQSDQNWMS